MQVRQLTDVILLGNGRAISFLSTDVSTTLSLLSTSSHSHSVMTVLHASLQQHVGVSSLQEHLLGTLRKRDSLRM